MLCNLELLNKNVGILDFVIFDIYLALKVFLMIYGLLRTCTALCNCVLCFFEKAVVVSFIVTKYVVFT